MPLTVVCVPVTDDEIKKAYRKAAKKYHPDMYIDCDEIEYPKNYYRINLKTDSISISNPSPYGLMIEDSTSEIESNVEKVYIDENYKI